MTAEQVIEHAYLCYHAGEISREHLRATLDQFGVKLDRQRASRRCPVCLGSGTVDSVGDTDEDCLNCEGDGFL